MVSLIDLNFILLERWAKLNDFLENSQKTSDLLLHLNLKKERTFHAFKKVDCKYVIFSEKFLKYFSVYLTFLFRTKTGKEKSPSSRRKKNLLSVEHLPHTWKWNLKWQLWEKVFVLLFFLDSSFFSNDLKFYRIKYVIKYICSICFAFYSPT